MRSSLGKHLLFLFGERLLVAGVMVTIAPGAYAIWLLRNAKYWTGSLIGASWLAMYLVLITTIHRKGIARIGLSLSATAAVLLVFTIVIIEAM